MLNVFKYLDISFENIIYKDYLLMRKEPQCLVAVTPHDHGWWVYAPERQLLDDEWEVEIRAAGFSEAFILLMKLAAAHDCAWIRFDVDAASGSVSSLKRYRWHFLPEDARVFFH